MKTGKSPPLSVRKAPVRAEGPVTLDPKTRSVDFIAATERRVRMFDWDLGEIDEILLMKGAVLPESRQIPLLDTHSRYGIEDVLGSARDLRVEGDRLIATATFSSVPRADEALTKIAEGHLTDCSVGYRVSDYTTVKKGEKAVIGGRTWEGPVRVVTSWIPKELSVCPIGADTAAKARSEGGEAVCVEVNPLTQRQQKEEAMNEALRKLLETRGLAKEATEEEAWAFYVTFSSGAAAEPLAQGGQRNDGGATLDEAAVRLATRARIDDESKRIQREETERCIEIRRTCEEFGMTDLADTLIDENVKLPEARRQIIEAVKARARATGLDGAGAFSVKVGADERDKSRAAAVDAVCLRASVAVDKLEHKQGNDFASMTLFELARTRMAMFGQPVKGLTKMELFQRALSTSDFANILADAANKALIEGFDLAEESYQEWVDTTGRLNDYKPHQFSRASESPAFSEVNPDGGEYAYGKMSDKKETVTAKDYGVIVAFTRAAMINDDLGALSDVRTKIGAEAAATWGDLCYNVLTTNPTMGDGIALFHASSHGGNLVTTGAIPSVTTLNTAAKIMATQKGLLGSRALNVRPIYILGGYGQKGTIDQLVATTSPVAVGSLATPTKNPWAYLVPVYDARLDAYASGAPWFLAGRKGLTVKLFTLDGNMVPVLETKAGWEVDGMEIKARISGAAAAVDFAGLFQNDGA